MGLVRRGLNAHWSEERERIEKTNLILEEKSSLEALRHSEPLEPELISDLK